MRPFWLSIYMIPFISLTAGVGHGKELEDPLTEKSGLSEQEVNILEDQVNLSYEFGKGLTLETPDDKLVTSFGAWFQLRYTFEDLQSGEEESDFEVKRARLWMKGHAFSPKLTYKFQIEGTGVLKLLDYVVAYKFWEPLIFRIGQFQPPQSREELTSSGKQLFADRSLANETFNIGRDEAHIFRLQVQIVF